MESDSSVVSQGPCDSCGSSDACTLYTDGHTHCFSCGRHTGGKGKRLTERKAGGRLVSDLQYQAIKKRGLTEETCKLFGYGIGQYRGGPVQVAQYRDESGSVIAQHIRTPEKDFAWAGNASAVGLFGQHLWRDSGKMVVVTEGEIDAMTVSQIQGNKWPVVSIPNGAQSAPKAIRNALEWLERFERVIFMFDNDEPGRKAALECAGLMSPGKAHIASLPLKDPNDMLVSGRSKEVVDAIWGAKQYRPDEILCGTDLWDRITDTKTFVSVPYPWTGLQQKTRGIRPGELVTFTAGTGVGKSEVVRQIAANLHDNHGETIGYIALEESVQRTGLGFMGIHLKKRLHVDLTEPEEKLREAFKATVGSGRYFLYDHWGSTEIDQLISRIRYMVRGLGCTTVVLDHISIVVSGLETDDERKTIDRMMTRLRALVEELQFKLFVICHLRRVQDTTHEEGGQVSMDHLRGSQAIAQLSNFVIALERNQQSTKHNNFTRIRVLKNRFTGETGACGWLEYQPATGLLVESEGPKGEDEEPADGSDF